MAQKYICKWCGAETNHERGCFNCRERNKIIKDSGIWNKKRKTKKARWEQTDAYPHELGSETQKLVDYVNNSGTIHYGRYVAQQRTIKRG